MSRIRRNYFPNSPPSSLEEERIIADCLDRAMNHVRSVSLREHIKADRIERVNHFITSIKRELSSALQERKISDSLKNWAVILLCDKHYWHDIGIPIQSDYYKDAKKTIAGILAICRSNSQSLSNQSEAISIELEELERSLTGIKQTVEIIESINIKSKIVIDQLSEVFTNG